ncbi:acetyl-CoA acetyltransferase [Solemya pervernicosa gill symbiont]|uniref:Acetyl-CoA acetyltransferase n=1 Tax=Solemya pervernicosa gill symbiont TaxID=642797 RepID=A0A1T2KZV6_9GAMM|nr:acetyl-CoA C-acetyltransferase [Solemya pervernicosa gill symbiont]OOZ38379.1 acetyl-CoA acetyltransferase [Solemya pervernicosa gill symbiont]
MKRANSQPKARPVYVVDGSRTPFLKAQGPGPLAAADLAVAAARSLLIRQPFEAEQINEVVLGCVMPGPDEANIARVVGLRLGLPQQTPAWTVQRNCASGLQAVDSAYQSIASGRSELVLAGGVEAMSRAPLLLSVLMSHWFYHWSRTRSFGARVQLLAELRPAHLQPVIALLRGLTDPVVGLSMGQTAELLAHRFGIEREQMDEYALESHRRLGEAQDGRWLDEIEPLYLSDGTILKDDNGLRRDSDMAAMAWLRPVFDRPVGHVTAGNSAQVSDGAAMLLLASADAVDRYGLKVLGRITDLVWSGLDPAEMGLGPAYAMSTLLKRHHMRPDQVDFWEINEAFAAQVLACQSAWNSDSFCQHELGREKSLGAIPEQQLNVDGGAIAIGHPVGASGARLVLHLLKVLEREEAHRGIASLCIGGGQGGAVMLERTGGGA